jgi:transformer-2 protein
MSTSPPRERRPDGANLYVSNLSYQTEESDLEAKFVQFGKIRSIKIIKDSNTRKSRGFGFVTFEEIRDAEKAIEKMSSAEIDGREIRVEKARDSRGQRRSGGFNQRQRRSPQRFRREEFRDKSPRRRSPRHRSRSS